MRSWLVTNQRLNTGVAIFHMQVKMLLMLNQSVSHKEEEIQNSNFESELSKHRRKIVRRMIGNQQQKEFKGPRR